MIISCDPGLTGAIALLSDPDTVVKVWDIPVQAATHGKGNTVNPHLLADIIKESVELGASAAYVEQVSSMPNQGVASTFKFGVGFGVIQGVLGCLDLPILLVTPQRWKKYCKLSKKDIRLLYDKEPTDAEFKDASRIMAIECFPDQAENLKFKYHNGRADSMMIGRFAFSRI